MFATDGWFGAASLGAAALLALATLYTDGRRREIPHWLVSALALLWLLALPVAPQLLDSALWAALACGAGGLAAGYCFHQFGWLGGGDGKLLGVLALWLGPRDLGYWLVATAFLGLVLVLLALARRNGDFRTRGIPFAWALAPPAATLLLARAMAISPA